MTGTASPTADVLAIGRFSAALVQGRGLPDDLLADGLSEADLAADRAGLRATN